MQTGAGVNAISDSAGRFGFSLERKPDQLRVRLLGYLPFAVTLDTADWRGRSLTLRCVLRADTTALSGVTITGQVMETLFRENYSSSLLDYLLLDRRLVLLVKERRKYLLRLTETDGSLISELVLPASEAPSRLHSGCSGARHVVGRLRSWEIRIGSDRIDTLPAYPTAKFQRLIRPCAAMLENNYFFMKTGQFNQTVRYTWYDPAGKARILIDITDSIADAMAWQAYSDFVTKRLFMLPRTYELDPAGAFNVQHPAYLNEHSAIPKESADDPYALPRLMQQLDAYDTDQLANLGTLEMMRDDSVYAPMFVIGDSIYLFNHPYGKLMRLRPSAAFNETAAQDLVVHETPLSYHHNKGWRKEVLVDEVREKAYGRFFSQRNGLILFEIDLHTGRAGTRYDIPVAPYLADTYRLRDGMLYFIGQPDVKIPNRQLYRLPLASFASR